MRNLYICYRAAAVIRVVLIVGVVSACAMLAGCATSPTSEPELGPVRLLTAAFEGSHSVTLRFSPVIDAEQYLLFRADDVEGSYVLIKRTADTTVVDLDREPRTTAYYRVAAAASEHEGELSEPVAATTAAAFPERSENFYGIHTMLQPSGDVEQHLDWARSLVGPGGYVKQMFYNITRHTNGPISFWLNYVRAAYERDLIPIIRLHGRFGDGHSYAPETDDGEPAEGPEDYSQIAAAIKSVVTSLPRKAGRPLYIEVWNEPNLDNEWGGEVGAADPVEYGYFLVAVAGAIREIDDPRIRILNGALSPGGNYNNVEFVRTMVAEVPESLHAFDLWASHPYPADNPPHLNNAMVDNIGFQAQNVIDAYRRELAVLARAGRPDVEVMLTETGYVWDQRDPEKVFAQPHLPLQSYTDFTVQAFVEFWARWPEVRAVTPFQMYNPSGGWEDRAWIGPDARDAGDRTPDTAYPVYTAIAALPKPPAAAFPELAATTDVNMDVTVTDNLAIGAEVTVSTSIDLYGWHSRFLNDGVAVGLGWTTEGEPLSDALPAEYAVLDLGSVTDVGRVVLFPRSGDEEAGKFFPQGFEIQLSSNGADWDTVHERRAPTEPQYRFEPYVTSFEQQPARYVRLWITAKENFGEGGYHAQLAEMEVYSR